jgi:hypothetical protein
VPTTNLQLTDNSLDRFPGALVHWANRLHPSEDDRQTFDEAFKAIDNALIETAAYLAMRETSPNREKELSLSQLWMVASRAVSPIDPAFADAMAYKGLGWANPDYWNVAENIGYKIEVTDVQKARTLLTKKREQLQRDAREAIFSTPIVGAPAHIRAGSPVLLVTLVFAGIFGMGCIYGGIQLMGALNGGDTVFNFIGLQFSTKQAGVAAIALGAATIILTFQKVLKTVVDLGRIPPEPRPRHLKK